MQCPGGVFILQPKTRTSNFKIYSIKGVKGCKKNGIWHDLVNNSLSSHSSNGNRNSSPEVFLKCLEHFREKISAINNNQTIGTTIIHTKLVQASYITISPKQHLLSNRKKRSVECSKELWNFHPWNAVNSIYCKCFYIIETIFQSSLKVTDQNPKRICHKSDGNRPQRENSVSFLSFSQ